MKKTNLILIALMALIFVSCSEDETTMSMPKDNAIEFGTYLGRDAQTRASVLTTKTMATDGFGVFAYYTDQTKWADYTNKGKANFMDNLKVTSSTNGNSWTYSPIKYWPNNDGAMVTFLAYAPWVKGKTIVKNAEVYFEVENSIKAQTDLVWNTENHIDAKKDKLNGNVNFKFNHALARIGLKLEAAVDKVDAGGRLDKNTTITVNSVKLSENFYKSGSLDLTKRTATWNDLSGEQGFVFGSDNFQNNEIKEASHISAQQLNKDDSYLMVIPQNFWPADTGFNVTVDYNVETKDESNDGTGGGDSDVKNTITRKVRLNLQAGNAYTLKLHIGMNSVDITASVEEWKDVADTVVNVPKNEE